MVDDDESASREDAADRERGRQDAGGRLSLSLPPIRLPPLFSENFRLLWPAPGEGPRRRVSKRAVLVALVVFDLADAALALTADAGAVAGVRVVGGALVAATTFGALGTVYVWEAVAALAGFGEFTVVPTLTGLLVVRSLREVL